MTRRAKTIHLVQDAVALSEPQSLIWFEATEEVAVRGGALAVVGRNGFGLPRQHLGNERVEKAESPAAIPFIGFEERTQDDAAASLTALVSVSASAR